MLGIETTAIPRSVKLRPDYVNTQAIVQLGELYKDSQAELFLQPIEGLQPYGTEKNAKMIVTAADGTVLRPDGEDSLMFWNDHKVVYEKTTDATDATPDAKDLGGIVAGGGTHHPLPKGGRDVLVEMSRSRTWHGKLAITFLQNILGIFRFLKT
jgi:hypothetical protein